jgi:hypothetical protein
MGGGHKSGIGPDGIEIGFILCQIPVATVEPNGLGQMFDGRLHITSKRQIAGEIVMQHRLSRAGRDTFPKPLNRLVEAVEPLQAPPDSQPRFNVMGFLGSNVLKERQCLLKVPQCPQSLSLEQNRFGFVPQRRFDRFKCPERSMQQGKRGWRCRLVRLNEQFSEFKKPGRMSKQEVLANAIHDDAA